MLAVDTNIIVRYITRDDAAQAVRAKKLVDGNNTMVPTTALLETEWVLRRAYNYGRAAIVEALRAFAGLPRVHLEDPGRASEALGRFERGMDFADALHLASASACDAFITFDRRLVRRAGGLGGMQVRMP